VFGSEHPLVADSLNILGVALNRCAGSGHEIRVSVSNSNSRGGVSESDSESESESISVCVECLFFRTPSRAPYRTSSACAKRATYPDPPPLVPHPESSLGPGLFRRRR